ncbi:MAG TPA: hypothetical protein VM888_13275 [Chitinophagaceae bacterium]|nr:hypothetical protein [Chitinophagaceae bacterium]
MQVTNGNSSAADTTVLSIIDTGEIIVNNVTWINLVDDIVHVWAMDINRPDLFCDTAQIKEIAINDRGAWHIAGPHWKGPGIPAFLAGAFASSGYYYEHHPPDYLKVYRYGNIWGLQTSVKVKFN